MHFHACSSELRTETTTSTSSPAPLAGTLFMLLFSTACEDFAKLYSPALDWHPSTILLRVSWSYCMVLWSMIRTARCWPDSPRTCFTLIPG